MDKGIVVCPVDIESGRIWFEGSKEWIHPPDPIWIHTKYSMPFEGALAYLKMRYTVRRACWPENEYIVAGHKGTIDGKPVTSCLLYHKDSEHIAWTPDTCDLLSIDWVLLRRDK